MFEVAGIDTWAEYTNFVGDTVPPTQPCSSKNVSGRQMVRSWFDTWDADVFALDEGQALRVVAEELLDGFDLDKTVLANLLDTVQRNYGGAPYHNALHAADVMITTHAFLRNFGFIQAMPANHLLAVLLAAMLHDFDHPGTSNAFEVRHGTELAILHSNQSVLERHHLAAAFQLLGQPQFDVLAALDGDARAEVTALIVDLVLMTDLQKHFDFTARLTAVAADNRRLDEDPLLVYVTALKFADIGHCLKPYAQHRKWTERATEEFFRIGDRERSLGLPISPLCDRHHDTNIAKSQVGFLKLVCKPFYRAVAALVDARQPPFRQIDVNLWNWLVECAETRPTPPGALIPTRSDSSCAAASRGAKAPARRRTITTPSSGFFAERMPHPS